MAKKKLFNEDIAYSRILEISDNAKRALEEERDEKIKNNPDDAEAVELEYKKKLLSIGRIRNNVFALMLRQNFECHSMYIDKSDENSLSLVLEINGKRYIADALAIKNVLNKDFEQIISNTFSAEFSETTLEKIFEVTINKKKSAGSVKKEKTVIETKSEVIKPNIVNETVLKQSEKSVDDAIADEMIDMMSDIVQTEAKYPIPEKQSNTDVSELMPIIGVEDIEVPVIAPRDDETIDQATIEKLTNINQEVTEDSDISAKEDISNNVSIDEDEFMIVDTSTDEFEIVDTSVNIETDASEDEDFHIVDISGNKGNDESSSINFEEIQNKEIETPSDNSDSEEFEIVDTSVDEFEIIDDSVQESNETVAIENEESKFQEAKPVQETVESFEIVDENITLEEPVISEPEKIIKITNSRQESIKICPYCRTNINETETICPKCGLDLINTKMSESELRDADEEEKFNENDIKRILEEIKADYEKAKREEEEAERKRLEKEEKNKEPEFDLSNAPKHYVSDNFKNVSMFSPQSSDPIKRKVELICDIYNIKAIDPQKYDEDGNPIEMERKVRNIRAVVFPLTIPNNGNALISESAVYIEEDDQFGCYCTAYGKPTSIKAATAYHSFIFRWGWKEGVPESKCIYSTEAENIVEITKTEIRPSDISLVGYGHPYLTLSVKYAAETASISVHALNIPDSELDASGNVKCLYVLEDEKNEIREMIPPRKDFYQATFGFEEKVYNIACKDCDDTIELTLTQQG